MAPCPRDEQEPSCSNLCTFVCAWLWEAESHTAGSHISVCLLTQSKRKDSEPRTKCLLNNADPAPHHPKDPVEMRRINFQTPGACLSWAPGTTPTEGREHSGGEAAASMGPRQCLAQFFSPRLPHGSGLGSVLGLIVLTI